MSDRLACNPPESSSRNYSYEPDDAEQREGSASLAARTPANVTALPPRGSGPRQRAPEPSLGSTSSPSSRALAAKFASRPVLPPPAEGGGQCVSVGELHVTAAAPGAAPAASSVGLEDHVALESRPVTDAADAHHLCRGATPGASPGEAAGSSRQPGVASLQAAPGLSFEETRRAQRVGLLAGEADLAKSVALELTGELLLSTAAAPAGAMLGPLSMLYVLDQLYVRAHEEGDALRDATDRDAANLAVVLVGSEALPQTYVAAAVHEYRASTKGASGIVETAMKEPTQFQRVKESTERDITRGRESARSAQLDSESALEAKLEADDAFRDRFLSDAGFRHGVRAEVMLSERGYRN